MILLHNVHYMAGKRLHLWLWFHYTRTTINRNILLTEVKTLPNFCQSWIHLQHKPISSVKDYSGIRGYFIQFLVLHLPAKLSCLHGERILQQGGYTQPLQEQLLFSVSPPWEQAAERWVWWAQFNAPLCKLIISIDHHLGNGMGWLGKVMVRGKCL